MAPSGYRSFNGVNDLDKNQTQAADSGFSQSEAFLPLSPDCSDIAHECDVILPIKGKCMHALEALHSNIWL